MRLTSRLGSSCLLSSAVFAIISISAFATRLMPLAFSQYPFNNDSLVECGLASDITLYGRLEYSPGSPWEGTHSAELPALSVLLAYVSLSLGETPLDCAQIITAVFSVLTVGAVFLLGRQFSGTVSGGIVASMAAILSGTFVFTTGSAWKLSLGFALIALLYFAFVRRNVLQYRLLAFGLLCLLPFVHHLAAAVILIALAFMLIWSWIVALSRTKVSRRLWWDTLTVMPPIVVASVYYSIALLDRQNVFASEIKVVLFICNFVLLSMVAYFVMSMRNHQRATFAPLVGESFAAILLFDYLGFVFPYKASAPPVYIILIISMAVLLTIAWYGTELIVEKRRHLMAVQMSLIVAPLTIILFGIETGLPNLSHQIIYRTFDFLQFFIFLGLGMAIVDFAARKPRTARLVAIVISVCLVCSFPFGFFTNDLLGVRHDSHAFELDSMKWLSEHTDDLSLVSDERLAFMAQNTIWIEKRPYLPRDMMRGYVLWPGFYYMVEDSWTVSGVNNFPDGLAVIDERRMELALYRSDVVYVGGPADDRLHIFTCRSYISYTS